MILQIIFGIIGLILGAFLLSGEGSWIFGALLGFMTAKVLQMTQTLNDQVKEISLLKSMQEYLHLTIRNLQPQDAVVKKESAIKESPVADIPREVINPQEVQEEVIAEAKPAEVIAKAPVSMPVEPRIFVERPKPITQPRVPTLGDKIGDGIRNFFTGGNPVVRVGMLVLFFGLSFLVKYAATQGYFPIEMRLSIVALIAITLIFLGWKTRAKEGGFGLVLQGGGLAALYLTSFAAAKMYHLMPSSVALILLFVFVIFGVILALLQNAQVLAVMAIAGGFLAPILTSDGSGNHVGLFSVYVILNLGVFAISWFKSWRLLNWIGFVFTFVISVVWGVSKYEPQFYASTQPFLMAFFFLYLIISILFSLKQPPNLKGLVDGSLVFGLPVAAFSLQVALLKHTEYGLAISAIVLAFIYIGLARWLWAKYLHTHRLLAESFLALGVGFATLAIPLGLNADWTSATWAFEAAGLLWIGLRQQRLLPRMAGITLYFAACFAILINGFHAGVTPIISGDFFSGVILSTAGLLIAFCFFKFPQAASALEKIIGKSILVVAMLWWISAIILELNAHVVSDTNMFSIFYIIIAASLLLQITLANHLHWSSLAKAGHLYFVATLIWTLTGIFDWHINFPTDCFLGLPFVVFVSAQYFYTWMLEKSAWNKGLDAVHLFNGLFVLLLLLWQASGVSAQSDFLQSVMPNETATLFIWFMVFVPAAIVFILLNSRGHWPITHFKTLYQDIIPVPFLLILIGWFFVASKESGRVFEFYLPIINPLDLAQLAIIILTGFALKQGLLSSQDWSKNTKGAVIGILTFTWINVVMLRGLHHYTLIDYDIDTLWNSASAQMALSILWTVCALIVMNLSRKIQLRQLWIVGAGLLALVVIKLFTQDLSSSGTVARIVSFMAVGGLMLLIGYLSPIPPAKKTIQD